jgi:hypothetical protein
MVALAAPTRNERRVIAEEATADIASRPGPEMEMRCEFVKRMQLGLEGARDAFASHAHQDAVASWRRASAQAGGSRRVGFGGSNVAGRSRFGRRAQNTDKNNIDHASRYRRLDRTVAECRARCSHVI